VLKKGGKTMHKRGGKFPYRIEKLFREKRRTLNVLDKERGILRKREKK